MTTAAKSRDYLRKQGWTAEVVEHRQGKFRMDLFGIADVLAFKPGTGILFVQAYQSGREKEHAWIDRSNYVVEGLRDCDALVHHHIWKQVRPLKRDGTKSKRKVWQVQVRPIA